MRLHLRDQASIVRGLARNLMPSNEGLPYWVDRRRLGQQKEHTLDPRQFGRYSRRGHTQAVLFDGPRSYNPQLNEVLRDDMEFSSLPCQGFDCGTGDFTLRMERLQGPKQRAGID